MSKKAMEIGDYVGMLRRILVATGRAAANADADVLADMCGLRRDLDAMIETSVIGMRANGTTWHDIGLATGTTRQAAFQKWGPRGDQVVK